MTRPPDPVHHLRRGRRPGTSRLIVCLGDSLTNGLGSANYVRALQRRRRALGDEFVNAGVNGDTAWNVAQRLDQTIACAPGAVTVLVGTNDVLGQIDATWASGYVRDKGMPVPPSTELYAEQLDLIARRLVATTDRVALIEIPPVGEDLDSVHNTRVDRVNAIVHDVAARHGCAVLPLHECLVAALPQPAATAFDGGRRLINRALLLHLVLRVPWNRISDGIGRRVLTDDIHLNDRGAAILRALIEEWLDQAA